jgi:hypothetical protein
MAFVSLLEDFQEHIKPEHQAKLVAIQELLNELQEQVEPWAEFEDDDEEGDDEESDEGDEEDDEDYEAGDDEAGSEENSN